LGHVCPTFKGEAVKYFLDSLALADWTLGQFFYVDNWLLVTSQKREILIYRGRKPEFRLLILHFLV
jgi:hypothetical protein